MGEHDRLRGRMEDLFNRIESSIKQILREKAMREQQRFIVDEAVLANLLLSYADGKISQFVRSNFKRLPTEHFSAQWQVMEQQLISA